MSEIAKASDHIEPCNIEQSERHNRRDADYIASLNPKTLYIRQNLSPNNESYVAPDVEGQSLQVTMFAPANAMKTEATAFQANKNDTKVELCAGKVFLAEKPARN